MQKLYWIVLLIAALATAAVGQMDDMKPKPKAKASAKMSANAATAETRGHGKIIVGSLEESRLGNISEGPGIGIGKRQSHGSRGH